jgi:hypothetical protein
MAEQLQMGLIEFGQLLASSPDVSPEEKEAMAGIVQGFQALVEGLNAPPPAQGPGQGVAPMEAGAAKVAPAM